MDQVQEKVGGLESEKPSSKSRLFWKKRTAHLMELPVSGKKENDLFLP